MLLPGKGRWKPTHYGGSFSSYRLQTERGQILEDLQAVERAFNDLHRKYERTKEVVAGFKSNEDILKRTVEDLTVRLVTN